MDDLLPALKALADETRMGIVRELLAHDLCVCVLAERFRLSEAAVSQHLQVLRRAGLVRGIKRGYWTDYAVERDALRRVAGGIMELVPSGQSGMSCEGKEE